MLTKQKMPAAELVTQRTVNKIVFVSQRALFFNERVNDCNFLLILFCKYTAGSTCTVNVQA